MEESFLNDTTFWYGVAAVLCVALIFYAARKAIAGWLDGEIGKVIKELEEAKRLRAEADATLKDYQARQGQAIQEAEAIVTKAKGDAVRLREDAQVELEKSLARQEQMALDRIARVQEEAAAEVRAFVVDEVMHDLRGKFTKGADTPDASKLVDRIIAELPKLGGTKVA